MFPVVDSDSHVFEPAALWDEYVPSGYEGLARSALWHLEDDAGRRLTVVNGRPAKELNRSAINRQAIWRPGTTLDEIGALDPGTPHAINPGASDPSARLADMDAMGVDQAIVYPTLFLEYHPLVEDTVAADVLARSYNDWVADFAAAGDGRLHPVAVLPLQSLPLAQRELDRVAAAGFRAAAMRPMFYGDLFIEGDHFQPLWRQLEDVGVVACVHPSVGVTNPEPTSAGAYAERIAEKLRIGHSIAEAVAGIQDTGVFLTAAAFHGLLEDFPNLKLAFPHSGSTMVPLVLEKAETYLWLGSGFGRTGPVSLEPEEVFVEHPVLTSFDSWEAPVARMPDLFAATAGWGSRYPNHDTGTPEEAMDMLRANGVGEETIARLMGGNAIELFGLNVSVSA
ncbi:MAG TPA: amidohydrolase family protein [Acidimicrobiia bacterium]|nr:amidohydrolase family protein [Acidimicrobiia bacterium]